MVVQAMLSALQLNLVQVLSMHNIMVQMCGLPNTWIRYWICAQCHIRTVNHFECGEDEITRPQVTAIAC